MADQIIDRTKADKVHLQSIRENMDAIVENTNAILDSTLKLLGLNTWVNVYLAYSALEKAVNEIKEETEDEIVLLSNLES